MTIRSSRNLKEEPLSMDEVRDLAAKVGGAEKYTFVTRPVIVRGATTGFAPRQIDALVG